MCVLTNGHQLHAFVSVPESQALPLERGQMSVNVCECQEAHALF
jgi:hypothetical protein